MQEAGFIFEVIASNADETIEGECADCVESLAKKKARAVRQQIDYLATIIAADTLVFINGRILEKPRSHTEAFEMLSLLQGQKHTVFTGVAIDHEGSVTSFVESTDVYFRKLSPAQINAYIATNEPFDKAGGYGIQGPGATLVRRIEGCFYSVMGLPMARLVDVLASLGNDAL